MTLATTETALVDAVESVSGTANVRLAEATNINRDEAEDALQDDARNVNAWEILTNPDTRHEGIGNQRTELDVEIVAHWRHSESDDSRAEFGRMLDAVGRALLIAIPQINEAGVTLTEKIRLVRSRVGWSAYRAVLGFRLWDVDHT